MEGSKLYDQETDSLSYMFFQVIKLQHCRMHQLLEDVGIYPGQHALLWFLNKEDGTNQKELADKLKIKPSTITVMLGRMEKAGLLERRQDSKDQRISRVYITEKGKHMYIIVEKTMKQLQEECFGNLTNDESIILRRLLMQIRDNLTKVCNN